MELTAEVIGQQLELQKMYRDDKFAAKLKELQAQYRQTQNARKALDERENDLKARENLCGVIQASQAAFNEQKEAAEARNLADQQHNQRMKDAVAADRKNLEADKKEVADMRAIAEDMLRQAEKKLKQADNKLRRAEKIETDAEANKSRYAKRLKELGLKAA